MNTGITRRDLLDGIVIGTGLGLLSPAALLAESGTSPDQRLIPSYYPPTLTGMRGSHEGSFEVAHALAWRGEKPASYQQLEEHYDLVVVGAGMSGLAAAWFYRKKMGPDARILLLDNHDDFGGHAKRNEFHHQGRMVLSLGGAQNLENPGSYNEAAAGLLADIGIDGDYIDAMDKHTPDDFVLAGKLDAHNGVALPGPDGHVTVGGNWNAATYGGDGYELQIRDQLQSLLGKHGFNHESDIRAITVNRIPDGYAYDYLGLDDPEWEEGQAPHEIGRARFGRISIANSDSEARAYIDAAFDAAWRAVEEQTAERWPATSSSNPSRSL